MLLEINQRHACAESGKKESGPQKNEGHARRKKPLPRAGGVGDSVVGDGVVDGGPES